MRLLTSLLLAVGMFFADLATFAMPANVQVPAHHLARGFRNVAPDYAYPLLTRAHRVLLKSLQRAPDRGPRPVVLANDGRALRANGQHPSLTWIGHSTFLIQLDGVNLLTDPHWGERASPIGFAGPRRLVPPGLAFENLPPIHAVLISHDHYDHLDEATVRRLARTHHPRFFVPLGLKAWFAGLGITDVVEFDWWDQQAFRGLTITCTPAQHSSGRSLRDQNLRLWSSWAVAGRDRRLFFAGDTGYYDGLKEIGSRVGPFDLALVPIGGYSAYRGRHPNHVSPEEALTLFEDVHARRMVPMHWGTFELNREPFREPPKRLLREAAQRGLEDKLALLSPGQTMSW